MKEKEEEMSRDNMDFKYMEQEQDKFLDKDTNLHSDHVANTIKGPPSTCNDFDDILNIIGPQGRFQKILLYAFLCPFITISPFMVMNMVFIMDIPDHWCKVEGMLNHTQDLETWKNLTLPMEPGPDGSMRFSQCKMYENGNKRGGVVVPCQGGWDYDKRDYEYTIPSEFDWVCDKMDRATDVFTVSTMGGAVGTVVFGIMADRIGRKPIYLLCCIVNVLFKTASLFVPHDFRMFLILQFLAGAAFPSLFSMPALIVAEVCGSEYRSWTYAVTWMVWVVGNSLLPLVAYVARTWFLLGILCTIPAVLLFFFIPLLTESPRWLLTVGKDTEALEIILKIAKVNEIPVDPQEMGQMVQEILRKQNAEKSSKKAVGFWTLFQKPRLAKNTVLLTIVWSMNCLLYYGVTLNTTSMAGNKFFNYFLLSIIELPSGYLAGVLVEKTGRRWTQGAFFLMCVVSCGVCAWAVPIQGADMFVIVGALGIKFGLTITSMVVYLQGAELFPTELRSTGNGLTSTVSSIIGITGPYIVFTGKFNAALPYTILGLLSLVGTLSSIFLPETFHQHLPETVEDANKFGKGVKFWSYLPKAQDKHDDKLSRIETEQCTSSSNNNKEKY